MKPFPMRKFSRLSIPEKEVKTYWVNPKQLQELEKSIGLAQALDELIDDEKARKRYKQIPLF
ncbi:MAG: hypothetical protein DDT19_00258 [Syntrophomonadaceae bacterium]|nr:hypothetical protein [Bacillota bacterium]